MPGVLPGVVPGVVPRVVPAAAADGAVRAAAPGPRIDLCADTQQSGRFPDPPPQASLHPHAGRPDGTGTLHGGPVPTGLPSLEASLGVSEAAVQLTLTGTTVGFALGQLVVGPLSDRFGRRMPLILATALHIGASLGAASATDIGTLGLFRVLMGIGAAGGGVVAMAMVRDLFSGYAMVRMFSRMALVKGLAPILAPVIGSQLLLLTAWPGIFLFLAGYGSCVIIAALFLVRETLPAHLRGASGMTMRQRYRVLFAGPHLRRHLLLGGMNFGGLFTYLSASPFLFQDVFGFSAQQYGLLFASTPWGSWPGCRPAPG